jgi:hypothetical protein
VGGGNESSGGEISHTGNGGSGGTGGAAIVLAGHVGGNTSSSNSLEIKQENEQKIVQVPIAVQHASAEYSAFAQRQRS